MKKGVIACSIAAIISLAATLWPQALRTSPEAQLKMAKYEDCRTDSGDWLHFEGGKSPVCRG